MAFNDFKVTYRFDHCSLKVFLLLTKFIWNKKIDLKGKKMRQFDTGIG